MIKFPPHSDCEDKDVNCITSKLIVAPENALTCPFYSLAYEIECSNRAAQASQIIHHELGQGHSNYSEASHNVLTKFRSKDKYLHRIHYSVSTNLGLLQANMSEIAVVCETNFTDTGNEEFED